MNYHDNEDAGDLSMANAAGAQEAAAEERGFRNCDGERFETLRGLEEETCPGCEYNRRECAELCETADIMDDQEYLFE